jgi:hypothetical protein
MQTFLGLSMTEAAEALLGARCRNGLNMVSRSMMRILFSEKVIIVHDQKLMGVLILGFMRPINRGFVIFAILDSFFSIIAMSLAV